MATDAAPEPAPAGAPDHDPPRPAPPPTWADLADRFGGIDRRRLVGAAATVLLVVGAAVAGYALLRPPPVPPTEELLPMAEPASEAGSGAGLPAGSSTTATVTTELVVHAAGAVVVPGVHRLPAGSRVADLLAAAGGPAPDADIDRVNLAASLTDGERVWFPRVGEHEPPVVAGSSLEPAGAAPGSAAPSVVDLNTASAEELDTLPGVGPATAAAIIEHRERQGPFRSVDDLLDVPGIGDAKLAQLRDLVTV